MEERRDQKINYAQLSAKIAKLEKSNRKLKRASKKRKRDYDSDSDDSDTSWSDGSGSTGKLGNKCTKHNKINHDVKNYPSPKATENLNMKNLNQSNTFQKLNNNCKKTQSEKPAELLDLELSGAHLNSVNCSFNNAQEERVTAVVARARYQKRPRIKPHRK